MHRVNTNEKQILHRIELKKFVPNTPLQDNYAGEKLQPDDEITIPQDDLHTISWEVDFDPELKREKIIGRIRPRSYRTTPRFAKRTITSLKTKKAA